MDRTTYYVTRPEFIANLDAAWRGPGVQVDWASVTDGFRDGAFTVKLGAAVAVNDTTVTVDALPQAIKAGAVIRFAAGKYLELTADAAAGATGLTVSAALAIIADNSEAIVAGTGNKRIKAGTIMARLDSGLMVPRSISGAKTAVCLLGESIDEKPAGEQAVGSWVGGRAFQNLLPDYAHASFATWKGELNTAGVGYFIWETYADSLAS